MQLWRWGGVCLGRGFRMEDGWVVRTVGDDELGMAGWLRVEGMMMK